MTEAHMSDDDSGRGAWGCRVHATPGGSSGPVAITRAMTLVMVTFQGETKGRGGLQVRRGEGSKELWG